MYIYIYIHIYIHKYVWSLTSQDMCSFTSAVNPKSILDPMKRNNELILRIYIQQIICTKGFFTRAHMQTGRQL